MTDYEKNPESPVISIQVIEKQGAARVVQWHDGDGGAHRCVLPAEVVREALSLKATGLEGGLTEEELAQGIPYGENWVEMLKGVEMPTPVMVAQRLRDAGIWTAEQARENPGRTRLALAAAYAPVTTAILRGARAIQKARR